LFCESLDIPLKTENPTFPKKEKSTQIL
jgi:hypothetical protein